MFVDSREQGDRLWQSSGNHDDDSNLESWLCMTFEACHSAKRRITALGIQDLSFLIFLPHKNCEAGKCMPKQTKKKTQTSTTQLFWEHILDTAFPLGKQPKFEIHIAACHTVNHLFFHLTQSYSENSTGFHLCKVRYLNFKCLGVSYTCSLLFQRQQAYGQPHSLPFPMFHRWHGNRRLPVCGYLRLTKTCLARPIIWCYYWSSISRSMCNPSFNCTYTLSPHISIPWRMMLLLL